MGKMAFMFPGQGAQYVGMMQDIAAKYESAEKTFRRADELSGKSICKLTFDGPESVLNLTENTQPCLLTAEIAVLSVLRGADIEADAYAGFSLGEWSALTAAGTLSFDEALRLVTLRGAVMQRAVPLGEGGMAVILGKTAKEVEALCQRAEGYVEPSNYNCPGQISVAGSTAGIRSLLTIAAEENIVAQRINVSIPSHCKMMKPAADEMQRNISNMEFQAPDHPIVMNCCAKQIFDVEEIKSNIILQLTSPVRMEETIDGLLKDGFDTFVEIGPGRTLTKFVLRCAKAKGISVRVMTTENAETLANTITKLH